MPELRFIIADRLPERELDYLKQNIRPEPDLKLVVTGKIMPIAEQSFLCSRQKKVCSSLYIGPGGAENESTGEVPDDVITEIGSQNVNCSDSTDEVTALEEKKNLFKLEQLILFLNQVILRIF